MIVLDASAVLSGLLNDGPARSTLAVESLHAPHLIDTEVASGLRRRILAKDLDAAAGHATLRVLQRLGMRRYPVSGLLERIWQLRENVSAYDASYIALAESLGCALLTADARLGRAPGIKCPVTIVPG